MQLIEATAGNEVSELFISELSGLHHGDSESAEFLNETLFWWSGLELHPRVIVGSATVSWVLDIRHEVYSEEGFWSNLDSMLRLLNASQASVNDWLESGRRTLVYSFWRSYLNDKWERFLEEPSEASFSSYAVVVSAVVLLSLVYQYLMGNVDRGGSKAYSRSSLDFRDIYVAVVLFLGAYVWIKFREAAPTGVHPRKLRDKQGRTKEVYEARLKPPMWNGKKVRRLDLGQFATQQEAHNKFLIAAFYYNRAAGVLDGWFQVPRMSEEQRCLTGEEKRKWVIGQAKKVYEEFKKKKAEAKEKEEAALLVQKLLEVWDDQVTPEQDELTMDFSMASLLNSAEHQQPTLSSQVENSGMVMAMLDNYGLDCASHSFDGVHVGSALPNGQSLGSQEGPALPLSLLPPNTESRLSLNGSDQSGSLQTLVRTLQQQISDQQQQISDQQQNIREFAAQILELQLQQRIQQQQLQVSMIQNPQWLCQFCLQQQQVQDVSQGFPGFEVEMEEQSMHQQNYSGLMAPSSDGGEVQEGFSELDILMCI